MAATYIATGLNSILSQWEDLNLSKDVIFRYNQLAGTEDEDQTFAEPVIGSELNKYGAIARAIPDYKLLRKVLDDSSFIHPTNFLPKVPKDLRSLHASSDEFCRYHPVFHSVKIPTFLLQWMETKRACIVDDGIPIPFLNIKEENWFNYLPYHSFYLKTSSPIVFEFKTALNLSNNEGPSEWSVSDFIIYEKDDLINVIFWAKENESLHLSQKEQEDIERMIKILKKGAIKNVQTFLQLQRKVRSLVTRSGSTFFQAFSLKKGTSSLGMGRVGGTSLEYIDLYDETFSSEYMPDSEFLGNSPDIWKDMYIKAKVVFEMINGFCKLMAHLPKGSGPVITESTPGPVLGMLHKKWYELNLQTIDHLETNEAGKTVVIRQSAGSEKSPHIRRKHVRRIVKADGTIKEITIDQITVREDKLVHEPLQGGALKIK